MKPTPSQAPKTRKLSSLPFAVMLMALSVLLMLAGVLPVRGGGQEAVFRSPVLAFVLALLGLSTVACILRRRVALRTVGFHLTHVGAVTIMIGALIGAVFEKKFDIRLMMNSSPLQQVQMGDGSVVDLGFGLSLKAFRVEKYPPNLLITKDHKVVAECRLVAGEQVDGIKTGITMGRIIPHAEVRNVELDGTPELIVGDPVEPLARLAVEGGQPRNLELPNGSSLFISRVYNNLPMMQMGHRFRETAFPARPGLILHIIASNNMAIVSLVAGEKPNLLSPSDPAMAPELPELAYVFPDVKSIDIAETDAPAAPFAVELIGDGGEQRFLIEDGGRFGACPVEDGHVLTLGHASDKRYEADLVVEQNGEATDRKLVINSPLDIAGWRLYLNAYDAKAHEHITLTLRKDPGDRIVVAGILALMIGTAVIFFVRRRRAS